MPTYYIPAIWECFVNAEVEAESLEEAERKVRRGEAFSDLDIHDLVEDGLVMFDRNAPTYGEECDPPSTGQWSIPPEEWLEKVQEFDDRANEFRSGDTAPPETGWYERLFTDGLYRQYWDGEHWRMERDRPPHHRQQGDYPCWRPIQTEETQ